MELTPRLALAAEYCRGSRRVIDVGCDHAYLCIALVRQGVELAWASDLRPGPLAAAREHIRQMGETERIRTVLCPGLESFSPEDADTVVICGMGGELMASILQAAPWTGDGRHRLVLIVIGQDGMHGAVMKLLGGAIVLVRLPLPAGGEGEKQKRGKKQKCAGADREMAVKKPIVCRISHRKVHFNRSSILVLCSPENDNF